MWIVGTEKERNIGYVVCNKTDVYVFCLLGHLRIYAHRHLIMVAKNRRAKVSVVACHIVICTFGDTISVRGLHAFLFIRNILIGSRSTDCIVND